MSYLQLYRSCAAKRRSEASSRVESTPHRHFSHYFKGSPDERMQLIMRDRRQRERRRRRAKQREQREERKRRLKQLEERRHQQEQLLEKNLRAPSNAAPCLRKQQVSHHRKAQYALSLADVIPPARSRQQQLKRTTNTPTNFGLPNRKRLSFPRHGCKVTVVGSEQKIMSPRSQVDELIHSSEQFLLDRRIYENRRFHLPSLRPERSAAPSLSSVSTLSKASRFSFSSTLSSLPVQHAISLDSSRSRSTKHTISPSSVSSTSTRISRPPRVLPSLHTPHELSSSSVPHVSESRKPTTARAAKSSIKTAVQTVQTARTVQPIRFYDSGRDVTASSTRSLSSRHSKHSERERQLYAELARIDKELQVAGDRSV